MTSSNGNIFRVTGHLQRTLTRSFDVFFDFCLNQQLSKQWRRRRFETPLRSLWCHCNRSLQKFLNIMTAIASQIHDVSSVCSTLCSGADQRKHQSFASFPPQRASNTENVSIWLRPHEWKLPVQPVTKIWSKWRYFRFSRIGQYFILLMSDF